MIRTLNKMRPILIVLAALLAHASPAQAGEPKKGERRYLYVVAPGIRNYLEFGGAGILVFDMDNGHKFVKRIKTPASELMKPENIKGLCDRFAVAGFDALAPDLYKGKVVPYHDTDAAGKEMNSLDFMDATTQNVRGAAQYLARNGAKVGLTGFCLGGAVTIIGATKLTEFAAGVVFYGIPPEQAAKPADVKIPLQAHFANKDDWCTPTLVDGFEKAMKAAGKSLELFRYDAEHAFVNEQRMAVHDRAAAELAWGRATEFFKKHLG